MGRKIKNPDVTKDDFLAKCEENHGQIYKTVEDLQISYVRYANWRKEDPEFDKAIEDLQYQTVYWVESKLMEHIKNGSEKSAQFYLKTNKNARKAGYEPTTKIEADVNAAQQIDVEASLNKLAEQSENEPF